MAKGAFVDTNVSFAIRQQRATALFASFFHFQCHWIRQPQISLLSNKDKDKCMSEAVTFRRGQRLLDWSSNVPKVGCFNQYDLCLAADIGTCKWCNRGTGGITDGAFGTDHGETLRDRYSR